MKKTTLVVLAAGLASRYGSLKQMEKFGPNGETIIDYAIYDAIQAGFNKVIFIIRESFATEFKEIFEDKLSPYIEIEYVYQELTYRLNNRNLSGDRIKPFGTGQALVCCEGKLNEPFAVVNADDFYGREAYIKGYEFLTTKVTNQFYGSVAFKLQNTISDNGYVSRGEIKSDSSNLIDSITERVKIFKQENGTIVYEDQYGCYEMDPNSLVSMNFFCFAPNFIDLCISEYNKFLDDNLNNLTAEFFMPSVSDIFINKMNGKIEVIPVKSKWFGVTYKSDAPLVQANIIDLISKGEYPIKLW